MSIDIGIIKECEVIRVLRKRNNDLMCVLIWMSFENFLLD